MAMHRVEKDSDSLEWIPLQRVSDAILLEGRPWKSIDASDMNLWDKKHRVSNAVTASSVYAQRFDSNFIGLHSHCSSSITYSWKNPLDASC